MHLKDLTLNSINFYDVAVIAFILFGIFRGRKHGMSVELIPLAKWLCILVSGKLLSPIVSGWLATYKLSPNEQLEYSYALVVSVNLFIFFLIRNTNQEAIYAKNLFGNLEYYLGMIGGAIRYFAILLVFSIFIAAPTYSPAYRAGIVDYNKKVFGGGLYSGSYFGDMPSFQDYIFKDSKTGPWIHQQIGWVFLSDVSVQARQVKPKHEPHIFIQLAPTPLKAAPHNSK